jgi:hypothetical protein
MSDLFKFSIPRFRGGNICALVEMYFIYKFPPNSIKATERKICLQLYIFTEMFRMWSQIYCYFAHDRIIYF